MVRAARPRWHAPGAKGVVERSPKARAALAAGIVAGELIMSMLTILIAL